MFYNQSQPTSRFKFQISDLNTSRSFGKLINSMNLACRLQRLLVKLQPRVARFVFAAGVLAATMQFAPAISADYEQGVRAWDAERYHEAVLLWTKATNEEDAEAMLAMGRAYHQGLGVLQDYVEAYKWFNLAASRGIVDAVSLRDAVASEMSADERSEARKLAREWKPGVIAEQPAVVDTASELPSPDAEKVTAVEKVTLTRDAIQESQTLLAKMGYQPGTADGIWGPKTSSAFRSFLRDVGLPETDTLTLETLKLMRKHAATSPSQQASGPETSSSILFHFASIGFDIGLNHVLKSGIDINVTDERGWTALMHAVKNGNSKTAKYLVEAGANTQVRAHDGTTAASLAYDSENNELIQLLTTKTSVTQDQNQFVDKPSQTRPVDIGTLLFGVLQGENSGTQSALEKASAEFEVKMGRKPSVRAMDEYGRTDLHWAAVLNLAPLAEALIGEGMIVDKPDRTYGATPLHYASSVDGAATARVLIAYGAEIDRRDWSGKTSLHFSAQVNASDMARILISNGADIEARDRTGGTPLHDAAKNNSVDVAEVLISSGANLEARDQNYNTPLNFATPRSDVQYLLISRGASIF